MDKNSLSRSNSDICDGIFPFSLSHETSDKSANFIMRNGFGTSNVIGEDKIMKLPENIVSLTHATNVGIASLEDKIIFRSAS